jgi:hypothetical protein
MMVIVDTGMINSSIEKAPSPTPIITFNRGTTDAATIGTGINSRSRSKQGTKLSHGTRCAVFLIHPGRFCAQDMKAAFWRKAPSLENGRGYQNKSLPGI